MQQNNCCTQTLHCRKRKLQCRFASCLCPAVQLLFVAAGQLCLSCCAVFRRNQKSEVYSLHNCVEHHTQTGVAIKKSKQEQKRDRKHTCTAGKQTALQEAQSTRQSLSPAVQLLSVFVVLVHSTSSYAKPTKNLQLNKVVFVVGVKKLYMYIHDHGKLFRLL